MHVYLLKKVYVYVTAVKNYSVCASRRNFRVISLSAYSAYPAALMIFQLIYKRIEQCRYSR